jgi:MtfA peptidase
MFPVPFPNLLILFAFIGLIIYVSAFLFRSRQSRGALPLPGVIRHILEREVSFYQDLSFDKKEEFEGRVHRFLAKVKITGVGATVEDLDSVLIAASAVIPIFGYPDWEYPSLKEVLLYPENFDKNEFRQTGENRDILGMVGEGPYRNVMILSQNALRASYADKNGTSNVGIHEFIHLVDRMDGSFDGLPETLIEEKQRVPWRQLMQEEMQKIQNGESDINPYALTNEAEFYAVVSEYYFSNPQLMRERHPSLYNELGRMFRNV